MGLLMDLLPPKYMGMSDGGWESTVFIASPSFERPVWPFEFEEVLPGEP